MNEFIVPSELVEKLKSAENIVFYTGAGISAESGVPTFRGKDGIWNKLKPEELANFSAFLRNSDMVWEWYQYRRKIVREAQPNAGHLAIAEFEMYYPNVTVVTQNVDNLHKRAGSKKIYELHGNIERNYCIDCKKWYNDVPISDEKKGAIKCSCGGLIRPDVVWFGEYLPEDEFKNSEWEVGKSDICFVVGTSAIVYPAAYIPITALQAGSYLVEVNIEPTEFTKNAHHSFFGEAGKVLPEILSKVKELKK
ncbi:MAG: NAD-dependent deacylase [Melioribacteraceae bacterium]|nr:NAD-dependent deacylase [Melioribacteraceae bacterium]